MAPDVNDPLLVGDFSSQEEKNKTKTNPSSTPSCLQSDKNDCSIHLPQSWVEADENKQHSDLVQSLAAALAAVKQRVYRNLQACFTVLFSRFVLDFEN